MPEKLIESVEKAAMQRSRQLLKSRIQREAEQRKKLLELGLIAYNEDGELISNFPCRSIQKKTKMTKRPKSINPGKQDNSESSELQDWRRRTHPELLTAAVSAGIPSIVKIAEKALHRKAGISPKES